jgi:superfamily II DNA or RNA helicase
MQLRPYQQKLKDDCYAAWQSGLRNNVLVLPTGGGKTVVMGSMAQDQKVPGCVIAHRTELVGQISLTMARFGIQHHIIGPSATVKFCIGQHIKELGRSFYSPRGLVTVAAVDTLMARADSVKQWAADQRWWMIDECHHVIEDNKWGTAVKMFGNAVGCGVTATPLRADRKSLHADQGGVFHNMIVGPSMRELINAGSLCDYRIFAPPSSIDVSGVKIGATGDYSQPGLREAAHKSRIVGDVVSHYLRLANGLRGITFTVDVEQANELAQAFVAAGVPAMAVSAKTPDDVRAAAVEKLRNGTLMQLVNVDLFGEGFDVPAVEVVQMARPTMSYGLFVQQFGRALRTLPGKERGLIIDHVGNVKMHNLPDAPRQWSLYSEERGKRGAMDPDVLPVSTCVECFQAFEAKTRTCPFCGHTPEPQGRNKPEFVEGDLTELDPATLAIMRGEIERIDGPPLVPGHLDAIARKRLENVWRDRQQAQHDLRHTIALWAGVWRDNGASDAEIYRRFFFRFGTDIGTAQTLNRADAEALKQRIEGTWTTDV